MSDRLSVKEYLRAVQEYEERLMVAGLERQVPTIREERLEVIASDRVLIESAAAASQSPAKMKSFVLSVEMVVRRALAREWRARIKSGDLAKRISKDLKAGKVPPGWVSEGNGFWRLPSANKK